MFNANSQPFSPWVNSFANQQSNNAAPVVLNFPNAVAVATEIENHRKDMHMSLFLVEFFICVIFKILPLIVCLTLSIPSYERL